MVDLTRDRLSDPPPAAAPLAPSERQARTARAVAGEAPATMRILVVGLVILVAAAAGALIALDVGHHVEAVPTATATTQARSLTSAKPPPRTAQTQATLKAGCEAGTELTQQIHEATYVDQVPTGIGSALQTVSALGDEWATRRPTPR
jgi:hypothetical protein